ncbi:MAG TPA: iron hydrogenase small subunit [Spirochaetota bacterium]|nr:iron hydrogenase small subunit [Spirochaetota bacterium]HRS64067.1 iron hydrogenase small subunit [Spirochaetota bacterium]HRU66631.1 iron hydrogenase small subunit [Spirochaetota bacterium]
MKNFITRKNFISYSAKIASIAAFALMLPAKLFSGLSIRQSRADGVYGTDKIMPLRKSQDNPQVKQLYKDFLEHPNSHKAHELLHTEYFDRSTGVKKLKSSGIKLNF